MFGHGANASGNLAAPMNMQKKRRAPRGQVDPIVSDCL